MKNNDEQQQLGELKLKKSFDEERVVRQFTHSDLYDGNVWYEPLSTPTLNCSDNKDDCQASTNATKFDHCMFEVYAKGGKRIGKEILHLSIIEPNARRLHSPRIDRSQHMSSESDMAEDMGAAFGGELLGLEVIEGQLTPLAPANFDTAGIDSSREHLIYRLIKPLDLDQGQLEHAQRPGLAIHTFTQRDLNKGLVLYSAPRGQFTIHSFSHS